jgi:hypothetical protein
MQTDEKRRFTKARQLKLLAAARPLPSGSYDEAAA